MKYISAKSLTCTLVLCANIGGIYADANLDPLLDGVILGLGSFGALGSELLIDGSNEVMPSAPDRTLIPAFDAWLVFPYNPAVETASSGFTLLALAGPVAMAAFAEDQGWLETGVIAYEALTLTWTAKNLLKMGVPRLRPFAYFDTSLVPDKEREEAWQSWPSGHTSLAFAASSVVVTSLLLEESDAATSPWLMGIAIGSALGTAVTRIASGEHFLSDTLAGAVLGSAIGTGMVLLHQVKGQADTPVSAGLPQALIGLGAIEFRWTR